MKWLSVLFVNKLVYEMVKCSLCKQTCNVFCVNLYMKWLNVLFVNKLVYEMVKCSLFVNKLVYEMCKQT